MIQSLLGYIVQGREWSWSVIGLIAILGGLIIRSFLISGILHRVKTSNRKWYKRTNSYYSRRAIYGWGFFLVFVLGSILLWRFENQLLQTLKMHEWVLILVACFAISLLLHLKAYARSIVDAAQDEMTANRDI
jgi:uncharacterized membrane protein